MLVGDEEDAIAETVLLSEKDVGVNDYEVGIRRWNPGPASEGELAELVRSLLQHHSIAADETDATIIAWLRCLYVNAYYHMAGLSLPYAATPIALIDDVAKAHCRVEITDALPWERPCYGTILVESNFETLPAEGEMWGHEWDIPLFYCNRTPLTLPPEAVPAFGKPETHCRLELSKLHTLNKFRALDALDSGNTGMQTRDQAEVAHASPPPTNPIAHRQLARPHRGCGQL